MFYYFTRISKKAVFLEKTAKNSFVGGHDRFEGRGASGDQNQYNLFDRHWGFVYFSFNNFFGKRIFFKITGKIFFGGGSGGGMTIFEGRGRRMTKMNITFFGGNEVPNTFLKLFFQKTLHRLTWTGKTGFGGTFSLISVDLLRRLFPKTIGFTHE